MRLIILRIVLGIETVMWPRRHSVFRATSRLEPDSIEPVKPAGNGGNMIYWVKNSPVDLDGLGSRVWVDNGPIDVRVMKMRDEAKGYPPEPRTTEALRVAYQDYRNVTDMETYLAGKESVIEYLEEGGCLRFPDFRYEEGRKVNGTVTLCRSRRDDWTPNIGPPPLNPNGASFLQVKGVKEVVDDLVQFDAEEHWADKLDDEDPENEDIDKPEIEIPMPFDQYVGDKVIEMKSEFSREGALELAESASQASLAALVKQRVMEYFNVESCRLNFLSERCPRGWVAVGDRYCDSGVDYEGFCGRLDLGGDRRARRDELEALSRRCGLEWPCEDGFGPDLSACPYGWLEWGRDEEGSLCVADHGDRDCSVVLDTRGLTDVDLAGWASRCNEEWPVNEREVASRLELERLLDEFYGLRAPHVAEEASSGPVDPWLGEVRRGKPDTRG